MTAQQLALQDLPWPPGYELIEGQRGAAVTYGWRRLSDGHEVGGCISPGGTRLSAWHDFKVREAGRAP